MASNPGQAWWARTRCLAALVLVAMALAGCGGGSGQPSEGASQGGSITSKMTGTTYGLSVYLPPASAGPRDRLPVIYVLDGDSWFDALVNIIEATHTRVLIVAVSNAGQRNRDFVPVNTCTPNGGGHAAYLAFLRDELLPHIAATYGGDPLQRALFGHSHGGSFVLYALFAEAPGQQAFKAYLASDASLGCMPSTAYGWEQAYAAASRELPVRLHLSYATQGNYTVNVDYAAALKQRQYTGLALVDQAYTGTHNGIVPQVLGDATRFAFAP